MNMAAIPPPDVPERPDRFVLFADLQEYLAKNTDREPFEYLSLIHI